MYDKKGKDWIRYCKAVNVSPYDPSIKQSEYYQKGFTEWKKLQSKFSYFRYMTFNA